MPDDLTPPPVGARQIKRTFLSALAEEAKFIRSTRTRIGASNTGAMPGGVVRIRNDSGTAIAAFGVLGISGILITPTENANEFQREPMLTGTTPTTALHFGKFVVLPDGLSVDKIGYGIVCGTTAAKVDFARDTDGWADVKNSTLTELQSYGGGVGARVLYKESGTGVLWAMLQLGHTVGSFPVLLSKTSGSDGTVSAAPSWVYTATDLAGNTVATGLVPQHNRPFGKTMIATRGEMVFTAGSYQLVDSDERPNFAPC